MFMKNSVIFEMGKIKKTILYSLFFMMMIFSDYSQGGNDVNNLSGKLTKTPGGIWVNKINNENYYVLQFPNENEIIFAYHAKKDDPHSSCTINVSRRGTFIAERPIID
jgi:hypothetical protein